MLLLCLCVGSRQHLHVFLLQLLVWLNLSFALVDMQFYPNQFPHFPVDDFLILISDSCKHFHSSLHPSVSAGAIWHRLHVLSHLLEEVSDLWLLEFNLQAKKQE